MVSVSKITKDNKTLLFVELNNIVSLIDCSHINKLQLNLLIDTYDYILTYNPEEREKLALINLCIQNRL